MQRIATSIEKKLQQPGLIHKLSEELSLSELNSLLLEVIGKKAKEITPAQLLKNYDENKFVSPAQTNLLKFLEMDIQLLEHASSKGFIPIELSPVAPLGSSSAVGTVNQNKIISAIRGVEVVADATNILALEISKKRKEISFDNNTPIKICSSHRHVRAQDFKIPGLSQHFRIFCMASGGKDTGNFSFEKEALLEHTTFYAKYLKNIFPANTIKIHFKSLNKTGEENLLFDKAYGYSNNALPDLEFSKEIIQQDEQQYYKSLQFKIKVVINETEVEVADGGFVDWTQQLTGNKKERLMISGLGTERIFKITQNSK